MGKIITVGREFGSGGREIGRKLAEKLRFAYYDHEIVVEIANVLILQLNTYKVLRKNVRFRL